MQTNTAATSTVRQYTSAYEELMLKLNQLPFIKIKKTEEQQAHEQDEQNNMMTDPAEIVENLTKCGLIVKKVTDTSAPALSVEDDRIDTDTYLDSDDVSESEYEIETLDEDLSDLEYLPQSLKRKRHSNTNIITTNTTATPTSKQQQQQKRSKREYIKIKSTNYMCVMCNEKFASFELLNSHMKNTTPCRIVVITCPLCGKEFPNKSRCTAHMQTHKEKPRYPCDKCGKVFANRITRQIHTEMNHTEYYDAMDGGYRCKMCEHRTVSKQLVLQHINLNHLHVSTFLCDVCGKSFLNEGGLRAHIMTHRDTKPFLCQICSKAFKMQSSLRAHIKTHDHEKRFVCEECGKSFKKNATLAEHKKYHAGDFSHPCNWCHKRFVSRSLLNTHMKNHAA